MVIRPHLDCGTEARTIRLSANRAKWCPAGLAGFGLSQAGGIPRTIEESLGASRLSRGGSGIPFNLWNGKTGTAAAPESRTGMGISPVDGTSAFVEEISPSQFPFPLLRGNRTRTRIVSLV